MTDPTNEPASARRAPSRQLLSLRINGAPQALEVEAWFSLLDLLRDRRGVTGKALGRTCQRNIFRYAPL